MTTLYSFKEQGCEVGEETKYILNKGEGYE